jgi:hypothetical protein
MLTTKKILRTYDVLLKFLKFSLKFSNNSGFKDFSLIENFFQLLVELEVKLGKQFNFRFNLDFKVLMRCLFKDELKEYRQYIDNSKKKDLVKKFELVMDLVDFATDREGEVEAVIIERELKSVIDCLSPFLSEIDQK